MEREEDRESSCSSRAGDASYKGTPNQNRLKLQVYQQVVDRLHYIECADVTLPDFEHQLWLHFTRLPSRYAMDVNVERAEDVVAHMKLLRQAEKDPLHFLGFHLRPVQVNTNTNGFIGDSVHSSSSMDKGIQGSVKTSAAAGLALSLHPGPSFGSTQNLEALEDRDSFITNSIPSSFRAMHEITFSAVDKPKLLSQLTSLLSELSLNIQEAHAFSTVDGFSLDVFVVDGWPHEETDKLRRLLEKEIHNMKQSQSEELPSSGAREDQQKPNGLRRHTKESSSDEGDDIDQSLLKFGCKVASGSHGDLYRGAYRGQEVAIKVIKPERVIVDVVKEFFQEVNIMRRLQHKNVVQFIGACTKPPNLFLVTEFMPKGNLYDFMHKRKGVFEFQSLLKAAIDIAMGMEYLHQNGILHRDLKTANLLMGEDGVVKVSDFGIARVQTQSGVMTAETGTYRWMAPEVISHKPYDHKADVFSFGIVLWELLTGELPYSYLTPLQAAIGVVQKGLRPLIPDHTHPKVTDLLKRCWLQEPNLRPDFSEIIKILKQIASKDVKEEPGICQDKSSGEGIFLFK